MRTTPSRAWSVRGAATGPTRLRATTGRTSSTAGPGGPDRLDGRGGDDRLGGRRVACGTGRDAVYRARRVARDCERVPLASGTARLTATAMILRDLCDRDRRCRMRLELRDAGGALLASARARPRAWRRGTMRVALPASADVVVARYARRELRIG